MAQQSVQLSAEEAATLRNVFQLVNNRIEESKLIFQNIENQHKSVINALVTLILGGRGFPNITNNWSAQLSNEKGEALDPVVILFEDGVNPEGTPALVAESAPTPPKTATPKKSKKNS